MATRRSDLVNLSETPFYHCVTRCVRQCYLCGYDKNTGQSFEHRRGWVEKRTLFLSSVYAIDLCAYAVMSNHVHVVLRVDEKSANSLSMREVLIRWHKLHKGTLLTKSYLAGEALSEAELLSVKRTAAVYRKRLFSISWFMRDLNEYIARAANAEDECKGRFWEGRFKSQALLDEKALLSCMVYVDLNPIRASLASTPEDSEYTSIKRRIECKLTRKTSTGILPFKSDTACSNQYCLNLTFTEYATLLTQTGKAVRDDKAGFIDGEYQASLNQIALSSSQWLKASLEFEQHFSIAVGSVSRIKKFQLTTGRRRLKGVSTARKLFG
ncbi:MAG TPA: transposase [Alteromonas australica]|jgi:REP-associated tyrosine transposase|uniref:Transposase n=1 Tax=Alteromonas australica TaxID=589873 RepID=A0A349TW23_9ALTE|nr:transposase [Alteromonas australica]MAF70554.1 transposase [Alteromonas sp.]MBU33876.1 transposase [Alteromonas sp.]HAU28238.1 transposase [Alteromonas australica]HAW74271.1 transposase [Alteromonas australica]HBU52578.1 transposase [Alteromonas australica]